jgi:4-hydroxy-3-polyprenylbenzoate decarboxylase
MSNMQSAPLVLAITGASGAVYAARLLQTLVSSGIPVHAVVSPSGAEVVRQELGLQIGGTDRDLSALLSYAWGDDKWAKPTPAAVEAGKKLVTVFHHHDFMVPIASGSFLTRGMVVCPCSGSTLSGIVHATSQNLVVRAADVHLKEHRKLILVNRETPLSVFQLENMHRAAQAGAVVLPAMPGWYHGVQSVVDLIDFVVARILDHLQIQHDLIRRWGTPC